MSRIIDTIGDDLGGLIWGYNWTEWILAGTIFACGVGMVTIWSRLSTVEQSGANKLLVYFGVPLTLIGSVTLYGLVRARFFS